MKTWLIWGIGLEELEEIEIEIQAETFDEAIKIAREINKNYNIGQLKE